MCFTTKVDEEFKTDQVVWIKQARVHYFCANILDAKNCNQDNFIKIEDKKLEFENDFKKNQECSNSITELSQISHHPSQSTGLNRDIENGARDTQGFGSVEVNLSAGGDVVKIIQQNMRLDTADSDDEF